MCEWRAERSPGRRMAEGHHSHAVCSEAAPKLIRPQGGGSFSARLTACFSPNAPNRRSLTKKMVKARRGWGSPLSSQPKAAGRSTRPTTAERSSRTPVGWSRVSRWMLVHTLRFRWKTRDAPIQQREARGASFRRVGGGRQSQENLRVTHSERWRGMCFLGAAVSVTGSPRHEAVLARWLPGSVHMA